MASSTISPEARSLAQRYLSRRQMLGGTLAAGALLAFTGFRKTKEIEAYNARAAQANQPTLFDQLGGLLGISLVIQDFINIVRTITASTASSPARWPTAASRTWKRS